MSASKPFKIIDLKAYTLAIQKNSSSVLDIQLARLRKAYTACVSFEQWEPEFLLHVLYVSTDCRRSHV